LETYGTNKRNLGKKASCLEPKPATKEKNEPIKKTAEPVKGEPPAKEFPNGRVLTRIWAEPTTWGAITWRVSQIRTGSTSRGDGEYRSLHLEDLWDGMRGLYQAYRWIRQTERRLERGRFFFRR
jgi:hypothetical protein